MPNKDPLRLLLNARSNEPAPGVKTRMALPAQQLPYLGPFLLLDHIGPENFGPEAPFKVPDHPHRGFETVTFVFSGEVMHEDSAGNSGRLGPGDVQWMTAAGGIIHSEQQSPEGIQRRDRVHLVQLWVNLPAKNKMDAPAYQDISHERIPVAETSGAQVQIIAGTFAGQQGPAKTHTGILVLHLTGKGGPLALEWPEAWEACLYVTEGEGIGLGNENLSAGQLAVLQPTASQTEVTLPIGSEALFLAGAPLNEPVAMYGPFVMNTRDELVQAFEDFEKGQFVQKTPTP